MKINKFLCTGRFVADPELTPVKDTFVSNFTLAVKERAYKSSTGERISKVCFIDFEIWDTGAKTVVEYFKKGDEIYIEGSLKRIQYEKDGQTYWRIKVRVNEFDFVKLAIDKQSDNVKND